MSDPTIEEPPFDSPSSLEERTQEPSDPPPSWAVFQIPRLEEIRRRSGRPYVEFLQVPALNAGLYHLGAGDDDPQRPHAEDEMYHVLVGRARFTAGGETVDVGPGTVLYVKAGVAHRFHDIREGLDVLVFFSSAPSD